MPTERENWSSRAAFISAAIGSAIGFGNIWRFPRLAFEYGGGAFFIPYLMALFLIGIPLLILEISVGQFHQTGDAGAFGSINKRARGLGLASVFCGFVLNCYYSILLAWVCRMFIVSCDGSTGRWRVSNTTNVLEATNFFTNDITGLATVDGFSPTRLIWQNVLALLFVWLFIFLCLAFGIKWTGRIAYFTVGLPIAMLIVILIRGATLDGAGDGIKQYIGEWDVKVLSENGAVWSEAVSQIFFSIGVTLGIMTAYASYNERNSPVFANSLIIAISNSVYSIIAGFAVFAIVGYIAKESGTAIGELPVGGPSLLFGTVPVALSTLPGYGHWERLLFIALFLLGIDSAFSFVEAVTTVIHDTVVFQNARRAIVTGVVCLLSFLCALLFASDAGLLFLDATDFYINFMLLLVGLAECFVVGWAYGLKEQIKHAGWIPVLSLTLTAFVPVIIASGIWFGLDKAPMSWSKSDWSLMWGFIALILSLIAGLLITYMLAEMERKKRANSGYPAEELDARRYYGNLFMGNMWHLRDQLVGVVRYIPTIWFYMIRFFIPQILLILFVNLAATKVTDETGRVRGSQFGNYELYPRGYQALGITVFCIALLILVVGIVLPDAYACFSVRTYEEDDIKEPITQEKTVP